MREQIIDSGKGGVVIYRAKGGRMELEVKLERETVWLSQKQIAQLFGTQRPAITKHLNNIFKSGELKEKTVCSVLEHTAEDGKAYKTAFYNLDAIISVGYRVNSQRATQFRIWATRVLKSYLVRGYALNQKRLIEQSKRFQELQRAISFIKEKSKYSQLEGQTKELLNIVNDYAKSLTILYQYDQKKIPLYKGKKPKFVLTYEEALRIINSLRGKLAKKQEASDLFGQEYRDKFKSIVGALSQTFDSKELYSSIDEKGANLLYLIIKDHPFADGNKRIASVLFLYFLGKNHYLFSQTGQRKISDNTMVALALLVAESNPEEKETMIRIIINLLRG